MCIQIIPSTSWRLESCNVQYKKNDILYSISRTTGQKQVNFVKGLLVQFILSVSQGDLSMGELI